MPHISGMPRALTPEEADALARSTSRLVEALIRQGWPDEQARETAAKMVMAWWLTMDEPEVPWED